MRFSLLTLTLLIFWLSTALLAWQRRHAWDPTPIPVEYDKGVQLSQRFLRHEYEFDKYWIAPDGLRRFHHSKYEKGSAICSMDLKRVLTAFTKVEMGYESITGLPTIRADGFMQEMPGNVVGFLSDDELFLQRGGPFSDVSYFILRRRFPENWWGHLYRPEVWALIVLTLILMVFAARRMRARHKNATA